MNIHNYSPPDPPLMWLDQFHNSSEAKLQHHFDWFIANIPERLSQLSNLVRTRQGYEDWTPTFLPESLKALGEWFSEVAGEFDLLPPISGVYTSPQMAPILGYIAFDIGIYWGEVCRKEFPELIWWSSRGANSGNSHVHYGQPVIAGLGDLEANAVVIAANVASNIATGERKPSAFYDGFEVWTKTFKHPHYFED